MLFFLASLYYQFFYSKFHFQRPGELFRNCYSVFTILR
jgi:hypothetical protein